MGDVVDDVAALRAELIAVSANAEERLNAMKRQQTAAKAKAKDLLQTQRAEAKKRTSELEGDNQRLDEELKAVKGLLREAAEQKRRVEEHVESLQTLVDRGKTDLKTLAEQKQAAEESATRLQMEREEETKRAAEVRRDLEERVQVLEEELRGEKESAVEASGACGTGNQAVESAVASGPVSRETKDESVELEAFRERISVLEASSAFLEEENRTLLQRLESQAVQSASEGIRDTGHSAQSPEHSSAEVRKVEKRAEILAANLSKAQEQMEAAKVEHSNELKSLREEKAALAKKLASDESLRQRLQSDFESSEVALRQEREKLQTMQRKVNELAAGGGEGRKMLEAKVTEMERLVASKQGDIVKVREKARAYLKDINAEKEEMEVSMKQRVKELSEDVVREQRKVKDAENRAESATAELDNCLALIREKQKSVQMLRMAVSTHKIAAEEAKRVTEALRTEFSGYKERARVALHQKDHTSGPSEEAVEEATRAMRMDLDRARSEIRQLRKHADEASKDNSEMEKLLERAERAEEAVQVLKRDACGATNASYTQIDALKERIDVLESELSSAQTGLEDAEARHETTKMRLEAAERALRGSEVREEELSRLSAKVIEDLKQQIGSLEQDLGRSEQCSAAAQRTAAVAAKALAFSSPNSDEGKESSPRADHEVVAPGKAPGNRTARRASHSSVDMDGFGEPTNLGGRANFAAALEGHSAGLSTFKRAGLKSEDDDSFEADVISRDRQIAVLSAQVVELGALLDDMQQETNLKSEQTSLLKEEVKKLDAKLAAVEKLQNGAPFSYLRTIVVRYLETDDATLLPVIANVLGFTDEEAKRVKASRSSTTQGTSVQGGTPTSSGYFSLPFLGSR